MSTFVSDTWERGSPYEQYIGRWSRRVAPLFLDWIGLPAGRRWLDVGCGTGALCAAILDRCAPASVSGLEPSEGFMATAAANLGERVTLHRGSATAIPLPDASVDAAVAALVLNFVPDPRAGLAEMKRVAVGGGVVAAYVWDYAAGMELIRHFWDAAVELNPAASALDEGVRFPLCHPDALQALFADAKLTGIEVTPLDVATPFSGFDDYWRPFEGGQGPAPAYAMSLDEGARARLRDRLRARVPVAADGSVAMTARAWAVRGNVGR